MHKMKEGYGDDKVTLYPTQVFSVNNWALKPNQPKEPPFTDHKLAICATDKPMVFKAPKTSSKAKSVSQGTKPRAQTRYKKPLTSLKQPSVSRKEATKGGSSKAPTGSKTGHFKKRKDSNSAIDSNPSQPPVSTPVDIGMHKEDQQAFGGPTSLRVTTSFIIYSESASGNDASAASTAEADPAPGDFVPQQQGMNEGTKNISYDHLFAETSYTIKLEDLAKLVSHVQPSFKDLNSPEDDHVIVVNDSDEDKDDEVHATENSQKYKLELEKNNVEAEAALLKAQPSFSNVEQLKELLVKSLKTKFLNITSAHDFSSSLPIELKDLPSKFNYLTEETVTSLTSQVAELETLQWELPTKFLVVPSQFKMVQAKLKTLDVLLSSSRTEGEHIKKDNGKKDLSLEEAVKESTGSDYNDDETYLSGSMVESSRIKKVKKFDFVTEDGKHIHLTEEQINQQKNIEEEAKVEATKHESEVLKEELIDLLSP
ncbi:hypothetical protein Tco_0475341 [Tanacetum coccineum]